MHKFLRVTNERGVPRDTGQEGVPTCYMNLPKILNSPQNSLVREQSFGDEDQTFSVEGKSGQSRCLKGPRIG